MFAQLAGKPEIMTNEVYACHTIADTDTLPLVSDNQTLIPRGKYVHRGN
jgi:hypothetical protein